MSCRFWIRHSFLFISLLKSKQRELKVSTMEVDDEKYLKTLSPGPTTPSQIHLQQLTPILIGGETLDPIKEEMPDHMDEMSGCIVINSSGQSLSRSDRERGTFWPEKPKLESASGSGSGGVKASTVLTNLQRGNIPTIMQTVVEPVVVAGPHQRAGQGELRPEDLAENDVNERDHQGRTPLMWSAYYGQSPTVSLLIRNGGDVRAKAFEGETALHLAASNGHHDAIRILLNHGAEVDSLDENDCTPLMFAAMQNHPHCVNELLTHGADFTKTDINGDAPLALAVQNGAKLALRVLENYVMSVLKGMISGRDSLHD